MPKLVKEQFWASKDKFSDDIDIWVGEPNFVDGVWDVTRGKYLGRIQDHWFGLRPCEKRRVDFNFEPKRGK